MIRFSYSNEDTKDEERRKGWVVDRRLNVVPSAKPHPVPGPRHNIEDVLFRGQAKVTSSEKTELLEEVGKCTCHGQPYPRAREQEQGFS
jgi:hypothetical protein